MNKPRLIIVNVFTNIKISLVTTKAQKGMSNNNFCKKLVFFFAKKFFVFTWISSYICVKNNSGDKRITCITNVKCLQENLRNGV